MVRGLTELGASGPSTSIISCFSKMDEIITAMYV